jgi:purine nucleosidase
MVHIPYRTVTEHLRTTKAEVGWFVRGRGRIGDYLADLYDAHLPEHFARSKVLWDVGASRGWSTRTGCPRWWCTVRC